jgi:CheY-like chemotaxis protein
MECNIDREEVHIEIVDTGIGIPQQHLDDIFQEFYQVDNPERDRGKGLGLGLAIVKRVCELLGHPLAVRSVPGAGSAFAIRVPLGEPMVFTPSIATEELDLQRAFVLVVDDDATVVEATSTLLRAAGCHVLAASSGAEALSALSRHERTPDAIISDYRLRAGETGLEAITAIHDALGDRIPALLITGDTSPARLREAAASGYYILHKPVDPAELRRILSLEVAAVRARRRAST